MTDDYETRPVPESLPHTTGFRITSNRGKYAIYQDSKLVATADDIDALAEIFDQARLWLQLKRHPILNLPVHSGFLPPSDHPSQNPN